MRSTPIFSQIGALPPSLSLTRGRSSRPARPLVRIGLDGAIETLRPGQGAANVLAPGEFAPVSVIDLPPMAARLRTAAAGYMLEERLAAPIEDTHVALGDELRPGRRRVAHCAHAQMEAWLSQLSAAGIAPYRLLSDVACLPAPLLPDQWTVSCDGDRRLVRTAEGESHALDAATFLAAWRAAGEPDLVQAGDAWDPALPDPHDCVAEARSADGFDLLQGRYRRSEDMPARSIRMVAAVCGVAILAHAGLAMLDLATLRARMSDQEAEARALIAQHALPSISSGDALAQLAAAFPEAPARATPSPFLETFTRTASVLSVQDSRIGLRALAYDAETDGLQLDLEASDLAAIQRLERALKAEGLATRNMGAVQRDGVADATFLIGGETEVTPS
jgi:general secretion pathway protein L